MDAAVTERTSEPSSARTSPARRLRSAADAGEGPPWSTTRTGGGSRDATLMVSRTRAATIWAITPASASPGVKVNANGVSACSCWSVSRSLRSAEPIAPCALIKNGANTKWRSPRASWLRTKGTRVVPGESPSRAASGMRSLCFHDTACTVVSMRTDNSAAMTRRLPVAAGTSEPLSISATVMGVGSTRWR